MNLRGLIPALLFTFGVAMSHAAEPVAPPENATPALNLAAPEAVLDLGSAVSPRGVRDPSDPSGSWFTVAVQNRSDVPVARVLAANDPPAAGLALMPMADRPALIEAAVSDSTVVVEHATALGGNAFRVVLPAQHAATLALHFQGVGSRPPLLAWAEPAMIAHNRQAALLTGMVSGLLTAAMGFAVGAALLSGRVFARWAGLFLLTIVAANLITTGVLDGGWLASLSGPYALFAFALALAVAAAIRLVDHVAPLEAFAPRAAIWRDRAALAVMVLGAAAFAGVPMMGLLVRMIAIVAAAAAAGYLAHCGRLGVAGARRLAPAAAIFALVAAAAGFNALGLLGESLTAPGAIGGFSAAGALLVALATAVPVEPAMERLRELQKAHGHDDLQATLTDEGFEQQRELAAVTASHQGVFDLDLQSGLLSVSPEAAALLGLAAGTTELSGDDWLSRIHADDRGVYQEALEHYRRESGMAFRLEFRALGARGRTAWFELRATMIGQGPEASRCLGLIADVTARKQLEAEELPANLIDGLTGLGNRAALLQRLDEVGKESRRAMLAVFDLDRFKAVNDSLGREGADAALRAFVARLEQEFAGQNGVGQAALFRVGGDMFAALAQSGDAASFGDRIIAATAEPYRITAREVYLAASVGIAPAKNAEDGQDLLAQAELAMVEAKRAGGGRVSIYSAALPATAPRDSVALETDLRRALEKSEIEVHYQPIMRLKDGSVAGFEALLRWRHPERGLIEPEEFVPYAETSGLIFPLGSLALGRAADDLARWQQFFPSKPSIFVSVNVSWRQIADKNFAKELTSLLQTASIAKRSLKLEVTEGAVIAGAADAEAALNRLKNLGLGLAIDDFGTGHSSLSRLKRFPFDVIKIDKSFIADAHDKAGAAILNSIISLARELKLAVVAEGVEAEKDATLLRQMNCEYGQGFLFSAPLPASEVGKFISAASARGIAVG
jgi:diguanylate cyclase (GGDEF)-like protein/PAS domain S-box-containing protein